MAERNNLTGRDLRGANLHGANLSGVDLRGRDLSHAVLEIANLSNANLEGANLAYAYLRDANLQGAILKGANLNGATLSRANLRGADLTHATFWGVRFEGADLTGAFLEGADFTNANLWGAQLTGVIREGARPAETEHPIRPASVASPKPSAPESRRAETRQPRCASSTGSPSLATLGAAAGLLRKVGRVLSAPFGLLLLCMYGIAFAGFFVGPAFYAVYVLVLGFERHDVTGALPMAVFFLLLEWLFISALVRKVRRGGLGDLIRRIVGTSRSQ